MSLKAKIEAVIYASEEPVTLAQLTGLLGVEGQAELNALAAQQHTLALADESDDDSANPEPVEDAEARNAEALTPDEIAGPSEPEPPEPETTEPETTEPELTEPETTAAEPESTAVILSEGQSPQPKDPETADPATTAEPTSGDQPPATPTARQLEAEQKLAARKLRDYFRSVLDQLIADYANGDRGLEIREVAGGFRLATKPEYHDAVRGFVKSLKPPLKLTLQALETLAVVAYKQPVTAPEVSEIRGVDSGGVLGSLLGRKLITTAGRKQVIGRPILYKTTKDFLLRFGLKDINELPSIEEFEKMAGELNDVQEEIPMEAHPAELSSEEASADPLELEGHNLQPVETTRPDEPAQTSVILSEGERSEPQPKDPEDANLATAPRPLSNEDLAEPDAPTTEPESISQTGEEPPPTSESDPDPEA